MEKKPYITPEIEVDKLDTEVLLGTLSGGTQPPPISPIMP